MMEEQLDKKGGGSGMGGRVVSKLCKTILSF